MLPLVKYRQNQNTTKHPFYYASTRSCAVKPDKVALYSNVLQAPYNCQLRLPDQAQLIVAIAFWTNTKRSICLILVKLNCCFSLYEHMNVFRSVLVVG